MNALPAPVPSLSLKFRLVHPKNKCGQFRWHLGPRSRSTEVYSYSSSDRTDWLTPYAPLLPKCLTQLLPPSTLGLPPLLKLQLVLLSLLLDLLQIQLLDLDLILSHNLFVRRRNWLRSLVLRSALLALPTPCHGQCSGKLDAIIARFLVTSKIVDRARLLGAAEFIVCFDISTWRWFCWFASVFLYSHPTGEARFQLTPSLTLCPCS